MAYAHGESYTAPKSERTGRRDFIVGGLAGLVIAGSVPSVPQAHAQPPQISHMQHVQNMEGKTNEERGMYVVNALKSLGYEPRIERYSSWGIKGFNIIFETGTGKQVIVFTSHYDAFPGSPGANDNASSVAVSINAYQELAKQDLSNVKARFIVFGDEEKDLVGSKQHVKSKDNLEGVIGVYSMELSGIGDTLVAWDVTSKKLMGSRIMQVLDKVVQSQGLELYKKIDRSRLPNARGYQSSDHVPFEDKDIDAFGLTIMT
ncbi:M28 family peptidase [Candidatus Woesearchaeota archaeon]|nr:M28 family peptidase [Candidatus Woesearchaeota archaeon]